MLFDSVAFAIGYSSIFSNFNGDNFSISSGSSSRALFFACDPMPFSSFLFHLLKGVLSGLGHQLHAFASFYLESLRGFLTGRRYRNTWEPFTQERLLHSSCDHRAFSLHKVAVVLGYHLSGSWSGDCDCIFHLSRDCNWTKICHGKRFHSSFLVQILNCR